MFTSYGSNYDYNTYNRVFKWKWKRFKKDGEKEKLVLWMPPVENNMKEVWDPILDKFEEKITVK